MARGLAARPLYKTDEARYGEISREMAQSGDWVTPRLNGFKYFEKPPLQYWAGAAAIKVFGVHDWAPASGPASWRSPGSRSPSAPARRLFGRPPACWRRRSSRAGPLYLAYGQFNTLDMGVSVFLSAAVFAFAVAQGPEASAS